MYYAGVVLMGLVVGVLVGLAGIGGGVVLVPAMVYLLGFDQHMAQGTSLFLQLPPLGLGAMLTYWRKGHVDLWAGIMCARGIFSWRILRQQNRDSYGVQRFEGRVWNFSDCRRAASVVEVTPATVGAKAQCLTGGCNFSSFC